MKWTTNGVAHSVKVLRPIDKRDNLWVKYDADQLGVVIDLLRCSEWQDHEPWGLSTGTKIIYRRDKKFRVSFGKVSNTGKQFKTVNTLDEARAVLSEAIC